TSDTIAGYKIAEIGFDHVKLAATGDQTINMVVGSQMRRRDNGPWALEINGEPAQDTTAPAATDKPAASSHSNESPADVIQRLMKKHQAKNNKTYETHQEYHVSGRRARRTPRPHRSEGRWPGRRHSSRSPCHQYACSLQGYGSAGRRGQTCRCSQTGRHS